MTLLETIRYNGQLMTAREIKAAGFTDADVIDGIDAGHLIPYTDADTLEWSDDSVIVCGSERWSCIAAK